MEETGAMAEEPSLEPASPGPPQHGGAGTERVSDSERDHVVTMLRDHLAVGRLTLDEFSERTGTALAARTRGDLDAVLADLPVAPAPLAQPARRRARRWIVAIMGESESKGRWRPGEHTATVAVMGECHMDLRRAEIDGPEVVITAVSIMGSIDIVVPEGIDVELTGLSIMGQRSFKVRDVPVLRGSPRILIRAFPIMGEVKVRSKSTSSDHE
jgi:hypothetical protein